METHASHIILHMLHLTTKRYSSWNMDHSFGGMFKVTGFNYFVWKSKMRDMLVCKDLWLAVQYDKGKLDKIDALT